MVHPEHVRVHHPARLERILDLAERQPPYLVEEVYELPLVVDELHQHHIDGVVVDELLYVVHPRVVHIRPCPELASADRLQRDGVQHVAFFLTEGELPVRIEQVDARHSLDDDTIILAVLSQVHPSHRRHAPVLASQHSERSVDEVQQVELVQVPAGDDIRPQFLDGGEHGVEQVFLAVHPHCLVVHALEHPSGDVSFHIIAVDDGQQDVVLRVVYRDADDGLVGFLRVRDTASVRIGLDVEDGDSQVRRLYRVDPVDHVPGGEEDVRFVGSGERLPQRGDVFRQHRLYLVEPGAVNGDSTSLPGYTPQIVEFRQHVVRHTASRNAEVRSET